jgi:hypothetical protein
VTGFIIHHLVCWSFGKPLFIIAVKGDRYQR